MSDRPPRQKQLYCQQCRGWTKNPDHGLPHGWYQVTVGVPDHMESVRGRGYAWVGLFCSAACMATYAPEMKRMEKLAQEAYEPVLPK